jgi:ribosomal protein S18 acetylase RimI-like enzyme
VTLTFRHMTEADIPVANAIIRVAYNLSIDSSPRLQRYLSLPDCDWLLAVHDGVVVGIGGATHFGAFSYIGLMGILPTMQGHGIGRALMEKLLDRVHARRISTVLLDASDAGVGLYRRLGFIEDDRVLQLQQQQENELGLTRLFLLLLLNSYATTVLIIK